MASCTLSSANCFLVYTTFGFVEISLEEKGFVSLPIFLNILTELSMPLGLKGMKISPVNVSLRAHLFAIL